MATPLSLLTMKKSQNALLKNSIQDKDLKFDQLLIYKEDDACFKDLKIFNRDGTPALNCINGKRCIKALLNGDKPIAKNIKATVKINVYKELLDGFITLTQQIITLFGSLII